ncbi:MAG: 15-cis-phytoene synthase [Phycisphaerales bacterium]|jgi:phytoene synthase|nr:15-cis-phytoene synthase [Phycisphaerales bacterium]
MSLEIRLDEQRRVLSYQYCRDLTRAAAKNFYYGLRLLPEPKRSAMFALYAYMRLVDDIADEDDGRSSAERASALENWRTCTHAALAGEIPNGEHNDIWPAFTETVQRYRIPARLFDDAIAGQQRDLTPTRFEDFDQLHQYCYQVAGVVGVGSIHIWGFEGGAETEALAAARGVALQLTNILRDVREDAGCGRIYLPRAELRQMNVAEEDLLAGRGGEAFEALMRFQIERAESYYEKSRDLESRIAADSRPTLIAMTEIYHRLLRAIAAQPEQVLRRRVSLSTWSKLRIGWRAMRSARSARSARADNAEDAALAAP